MNPKYHVDVVVIGSGPSGYSSAFRCADLGLKTVIVERFLDLGGVCLNAGCIPSKALLHVSKVLREAKSLSDQGVFFKEPDIDIDRLSNWKKRKIKEISKSIRKMAEDRKIDIFLGEGKFLTRNVLLVKMKNTDIKIFFKYAIIAVGSESVKLSTFKYSHPRVWNSTSSLNFDVIPNRLLVVGGGIIGLEMATVYSAFGTKVDILDTSKVSLPFLDRDVASFYFNLAKRLFCYKSNSSLVSVKDEKDGFLVFSKDASRKTEKNRYDYVLVAVGRKPLLNCLNVLELGIKLDKFGFIIVDSQQKTNISNIFAVGDVTGKPMLAHKGTHEGRIAAEVIDGGNVYFDPKVIPSVAYTDPEIAWVGLNEVDAQKKNIEYESVVFPWNASGRAIVSNCSEGFTKLLFSKKTNKILGGAIVGANAGELIGEITLAIEMGCDAEDIALTIHAHPTLSESICLASQIFQGTITDLPNRKKKNRII